MFKLRYTQFSGLKFEFWKREKSQMRQQSHGEIGASAKKIFTEIILKLAYVKNCFFYFSGTIGIMNIYQSNTRIYQVNLQSQDSL